MPGSLMLALPFSMWPAYRYSNAESPSTVTTRSYQPLVRSRNHRSASASPGFSDNVVGRDPYRLDTTTSTGWVAAVFELQ